MAAAGGTTLTIGVGALRPQRERPRRGRRLAVLRQRLARAGGERSTGRSSCRPATSRRIRCRARPARSRPCRHAVSAVHQRGHVAAEVRRARRLRHRRRRHGTLAGGVAGTEGIIHSGIGPFDIASDSRMTYFDHALPEGGRRIAFFTNLLDGDATNLLARGPTGAAAAARLSTPRRSTSRPATSARSARGTC